jgi:hypothetical protein
MVKGKIRSLWFIGHDLYSVVAGGHSGSLHVHEWTQGVSPMMIESLYLDMKIAYGMLYLA